MIIGGDFTIGYGMLIWGAVLVALLLVQRSQATLGVGLVLAYFLNLGLIHLPGAYLYLNPDYQFYNPAWISLGFEQSSYGVAAFGAGAAGTLWLLRHSRRFVTQEQLQPSQLVFNAWLHRFYVFLGLVSYFGITPLARSIPSASAIVSVLNQLLLVGICLGMWNAWHSRQWLALLFWILALGALPLMTVLSQGFLGFGAVALLTGLAFLASFFRPRWLVLLIGILFIFVGLSVFVTYFRDRTEIRQVVWENQDLSDRIGQLTQTFSDFEWFDINNRNHANYLDQRLNQNWLVGVAVERITQNKVDYRYGATVLDAALALIPRAIWPDKPVQAGSGNLVSDATGVPFAQGTSVGVGQVLEFYFNFGTIGVVVGLFLWGVVLALLDSAAAYNLSLARVRRFTLFYLVGLGLNQPGGSLVDVVGTAAAGAVAALIVNDVLAPFFVGVFEEEPEDEKPAPRMPQTMQMPHP